VFVCACVAVCIQQLSSCVLLCLKTDLPVLDSIGQQPKAADLPPLDLTKAAVPQLLNVSYEACLSVVCVSLSLSLSLFFSLLTLPDLYNECNLLLHVSFFDVCISYMLWCS